MKAAYNLCKKIPAKILYLGMLPDQIGSSSKTTTIFATLALTMPGGILFTEMQKNRVALECISKNSERNEVLAAVQQDRLLLLI